MCGKQSIEDVLSVDTGSIPETYAGLVLDIDLVRRLPDLMRDGQTLFDRTGGLHAAALFEHDGSRLVVREDIGRHNAVDKVFGTRLLAGQPTVPVLVVSGRIGFELVQKAVVSGVAALVAVGAPSSLAVELARDAGLCLVGFTRPERCVVYSMPERLGV